MSKIEFSIEQACYQFDSWVVIPEVNQLRQGERITKIEPRVMAALCYFLENPNRVISRDELIRAVWPQHVTVTDHSVTQMLANLRKALNETAKNAKYIETIPKKGYRFVGQLLPMPATQNYEPHHDISTELKKHYARVKNEKTLLIALLLSVLCLSVIFLNTVSQDLIALLPPAVESSPQAEEKSQRNKEKTPATFIAGIDLNEPELVIDTVLESDTSVYEPVFNLKTGKIAYTGFSEGVTQIWSQSSTHRKGIPLTFAQHGAFSPHWSHNGEKLVYLERNDKNAAQIKWFHQATNKHHLIDTHLERLWGPRWHKTDSSIIVSGVELGRRFLFEIDEATHHHKKISPAGAIMGYMSDDAAYVYFVKEAQPGIWRYHTVREIDELVIPDLEPKNWSNWVLENDKIYYVKSDEKHDDIIEYDLMLNKRSRRMSLPPGSVAKHGTGRLVMKKSQQGRHLLFVHQGRAR